MNANNLTPPAPNLPRAGGLPTGAGSYRWQETWLAAATGDNPLDPIAISCVIPLLNEEENLRPLYAQLREALTALEQPYELIFVDDGSSDGSFAVLQQLYLEDKQVRVIRLRRNFGQAAAFSAGFDLARGNIIVTLDADLQSDPGDIQKLLAKMAEGYDAVSGWRTNRHDAYLTRQLPSQVANLLISAVTGVRLHDYGCSLKAYRSEILKDILLYGQMHRFLPALVSWMGIRVAEIPVKHAKRKFGRSKYGLGRVVMVVLDLIAVKFLLDYATRPIQIFGLLGLICTALGVGLGLYLSTLKLVLHQGIGDRPLLLLSVLLTILGIQFVTMGLLGELVIRNRHEPIGKRIYAVRELLVH
jgi:glycosyltransferase involved in cell wall biosynthesis